VEATLNRDIARTMQMLHVAFRSLDTVGAGSLQPHLSTAVCEQAGLDLGPGFGSFVMDASVCGRSSFNQHVLQFACGSPLVHRQHVPCACAVVPLSVAVSCGPCTIGGVFVQVDTHLTFSELKHLIVSYYMQHQGALCLSAAAACQPCATHAPPPEIWIVVHWLLSRCGVAALRESGYPGSLTTAPLPGSEVPIGSPGGTASEAGIAVKIRPKWMAVRRAFKAFDAQGTGKVSQRRLLFCCLSFVVRHFAPVV
jgi:hypothetical protein